MAGKLYPMATNMGRGIGLTSTAALQPKLDSSYSFS